MIVDLAEFLNSIRPTSPATIMDLVADAGVDVLPWAVKKDGSPVKNPRANPHYCYEWAFGGGEEPTVLCVWHHHLQVISETIEYVDNLRGYALRLEELATDHRTKSDVKARSRDQAKRARNFDLLLQRAFRKGVPVRVVLLVGDASNDDELGLEASKVRYRSLDTEPWFVHDYSDSTGAFRLVRSHHDTATSTDQEEEDPTPVLFVDQFSIPVEQTRIKVETTAIVRSPEVRRKALERAQGCCEHCCQPGFKMENGAIYLETHHVIPLAENGPDVEWNVVAICPNDHRRAHFSVEKNQLMADMISKLESIYPSASKSLRALLAMDSNLAENS